MNAPDRTAASGLIRRLDARAPQFDAQLKALLSWEAEQDVSVEQAVSQILDAIRQHGDAALIEFTHLFDRLQVVQAQALELSKADFAAALQRSPASQREACLLYLSPTPPDRN